MALNPYETRQGRVHRLAETSRRQFLLLIATLGAIGASILGGFESLKFLFPNATGEEPPQFKTTFKANVLTAESPVRSITEKRVTVVQDNAGIYAVYLICTHLGCTPNYTTTVTIGLDQSQSDRAAKRGIRGSQNVSSGATGTPPIPNGWACPCHGSRYFIDSTNFFGPAPRPMDWIKVAMTTDGYLLVDRSKLVAYRQPGDQTAPEWRLDPKTGKDNGKTLGAGA
jgi:cytochrome b6-f complex iron-sulfur subunit